MERVDKVVADDVLFKAVKESIKELKSRCYGLDEVGVNKDTTAQQSIRSSQI